MRKSERLKYLRVLYQLNQTEVANSIGVKRSYISQLENEKLPMSEEQYRKLIDGIYKVGEVKKKRALLEDIEEIREEIKELEE